MCIFNYLQVAQREDVYDLILYDIRVIKTIRLLLIKIGLTMTIVSMEKLKIIVRHQNNRTIIIPHRKQNPRLTDKSRETNQEFSLNYSTIILNQSISLKPSKLGSIHQKFCLHNLSDYYDLLLGRDFLGSSQALINYKNK